jgi:hypothetical protein
VDNLTPLVEKAFVNHRVINEREIHKKISTAAKAITPQKAALSPAISPTVEPLLKERNGHIRQPRDPDLLAELTA